MATTALYLLSGELFKWGTPRVAKVMKVDPTTVLHGTRAAKDRINRDDAERLRLKRALSAYIEETVMGES